MQLIDPSELTKEERVAASQAVVTLMKSHGLPLHRTEAVLRAVASRRSLTDLPGLSAAEQRSAAVVVQDMGTLSPEGSHRVLTMLAQPGCVVGLLVGLAEQAVVDGHAWDAMAGGETPVPFPH